MQARTEDGAWIWYETSGAGYAVVLIHGLADDHQLWRHQVPALAQRYLVVSLDMRGHGRSSKRPLPVSTEMLAGDVLTVCDALGLDRFAVVGLSMGGGIAQTIALMVPTRMWGLCLVSTSSAFPLATRRRFHERAALAEREGMAPLVDGMVERWFTPSFIRQAPQEVARTRETVIANDPVAYAAAARLNAERDWTDRLVAIDCPTTFIGGAEDPADAYGKAETFRAVIPGMTVEMVEGASHLVPIERPAECSRLLLQALDRSNASPFVARL